jgi:hypothetical protein
MKFLTRPNTLKINMHYQLSMRMHLDFTKNHLLRSLVCFEIYNGGVKSLFFETMHNLIMIKHHALVIFSRSIDNRRNKIFPSLPAARACTK